jgi:hypothetical protein
MSHFSTPGSLGGATDDQKDPLVKKSSFSWTKAAFQAPLQNLSVQQFVRSKKRKLQGWRFGLAMSASSAIFVLLTNVLLMIGAASASKLDRGIGTLYIGSCGIVNKWNLALHLLINILSSILLSASNYAMQILSSPTRSECDKAHARRDWLDIGVNGLRNLTRISWQRRILWTLLGISSVPIHLLFNSAVFKTLDANDYFRAVVTTDFLDGGEIMANDPYSNPYYRDFDVSRLERMRSGYHASLISIQQRYRERKTMYEQLDPTDCISKYGGPFVSGHSNVFLVTNSTDANLNAFNYIETPINSQEWYGYAYTW